MKSLSVRTWGKPGLPPVLFLHGFMGSHDDWTPIAEQLADTWHCLAVDLPGHGASPLPGDLTFQSACALILATLDAADIERCHLVGYSLGGRLALNLMLGAPERFAAVVVESACPGLETSSARAARAAGDAQLAERLRREPLADFLRDWYALPLFGLTNQPQLIERLVALRQAQDGRILAAALEALSVSRQPDLWPQLAAWDRQWLYLAGADDAKYQGIAQRVKRDCPGASVEILADCGHNSHLQAPAAFTLRIQAFFQQEAPDE